MDFLLSSNLIVGFILIQPILDLVTSLAVRNMELPITLGLAIRSLFMVYLCIYVLVTKSNNNKLIKYSKIALSMILIYITFFLVFIIFSKDRSLILIEVKGIIKSFYFPIVLCGLFVYNQKDKINISNKLLVLTLMIYTSTIFIATVTNTYFNSYNSNGYGSVGWFYAANEIGSIMAILIPFTISSLVNDTERLLNTLACAICIASTMFLGTKVPFLALGGTTVFIIIYYIILNIYNKFSSYYKRDFNLKRIILMMSTILISMILIFPFSPLYKNIQRNYGDIIQRIVNNISHNKVDQNTQIEDKDNLDPVSKDEIVTAVLSKRTIYADIIKQKFNNSSWIDKLFGIGYNVEIRDEIYAKKTIDSKQLELLQKLGFIVEINDEVYTQKTIELDQLDILYRHGILGFTVYFAQFLAIIILIAKQIIFKSKYLLNLDIVICIIDIVLALGIAFTAGHILTAPAVGFFLITSTIKLYNEIFNKVV